MRREAFFSDRWWAVAQRETATVAGDVGARVESEDLARGYTELALEIIHLTQSTTKLLLKSAAQAMNCGFPRGTRCSRCASQA